MSTDKTDLTRFVEAQDKVWGDVCQELQAGTKTTHWMWFIFPQLRALGRSGTAHFYGLAGASEAKAYLAHPVLGPRLRDGHELMLTHRDKSAVSILGSVDALKLRSCATLFYRVSGEAHPFMQVLEQFYEGQECPQTLALLETET